MTKYKPWVFGGTVVFFAIWALIAKYTQYLGETSIPIVIGVLAISILIGFFYFLGM